jgi:hypothetical protein
VNTLPLALSLTSSFTKIGAIAGFAALLGIALLSLLAFTQGREMRRLREWAGRAPERAAEMEQRVSAEAAARLQRAGAPVAAAAAGARVVPGGASAAPPGTQVVPRKTPLVSAPVSTAVNATVAAGKIGAPPDAASAAAAGPAAVDPVTIGPAAADPVVADPAVAGAAQVAAAAAPADVAQAGAVQSNAATTDGGPPNPTSNAVQALPAGQPESGVSPDSPLAGVSASALEPASAPATAAARAAVPATPAVGPAAPPPRSPLPPSPSAPKPALRPSPAVAASRPMPSRAVLGRGGDSVSKGAAPTAGAPAGSGPKYFKRERSAGRMTLLVLGGVVVGVAAIVLAVSALKGGGGKPNATATQPPAHSTVTHTGVSAPASNPSELSVAVLNGTSTTGLAHHLAADLRQSGYTHAEASSAVPPGTHATTVVQYASGHRADGQAVAKALNVTRVQPMEASTASLVSQATVVVLAGADQAAQLGAGGAQGSGEAAAGTGGEAGAGGAAEGAASSGQ